MITDLVRNATLLIALIVLYDLLGRKKNTDSFLSQIINGFLFGGIAIIGMNMPITYSPGVFYDGRTVVVSLACFFSGGITSLLSVLLAGTYRIYLAGTGIWAGTASIICAAFLGRLFRYFYSNKPETVNISGLAMIGVSVHLSVLLCQLILPWPSGLEVIRRLWISVLLIFPAATLITGLFLRNTLKKMMAEAFIRRNEGLTERLPVGIFRTDPYGFTTFVNPKWCQLSGLSPKEAIGEIWLNAIHPDDREHVRKNWNTDIHLEQRSLAQYRFLRPDGRPVWVLSEAVPEIGDEGRILGYIGTITDISEQKRAEHELAQSRENFRQSMDESPLGMRIVTESGRTLYMNKALLDIYGFKNVKEFQDTPAERRYPENYLHLHQQRKERRKRGEEVESEYDIELVRKDGSLRNVHIYRKMLNWDGKPRYLAIYQDYTDRKKAENALEQAKNKAEESDRLKSAFLANMSHEIRTPLNTILGFSSILAAEEEISPEEKEEYSFIINRSSDNLLQIINDILDISKLETGQLQILNTRFNAVPVLDELSRVFEKRLSELGKKDIRLRLSTSDNPVYLNLDRVRFYQIFTNLLNNSVKFTEKGEIGFGMSGIAENEVSFFVSDTGIGIQKELHSAVFERFRQVNETSTRTHGGTGLGLSIVRNLVELMGGTITVESEPGRGTTFLFTMPAESNQLAARMPSVN